MMLKLKLNQKCMHDGSMTCPTKEKLRRSICSVSEQTGFCRRGDQHPTEHIFSRLFCHLALRQNMTVERECRTGRHVYEASIPIFKHTLLEKGQLFLVAYFMITCTDANICGYFIFFSSVCPKGKHRDLLD